MKKMMYVFMITFTVLMYSCKESTVNPNDFKEKKEFNLTNNVWVFSSSSTSKLPEKSKIKFSKNKAFFFIKDSTWQNGSWEIDTLKNQVNLSGKNWQESAELISVINNKLVLKMKIDGVITELTYIPEIFKIPNLIINGIIQFDSSMTNQDLTNAQVCLLSPTINDYRGTMTVYGIGTINMNDKTFSIQLDSTITNDFFVSSSYNNDGYFNLGFIYLIWNENYQIGQTLTKFGFMDRMLQFGCMEDRAILFINGNYKKWNYNNLWHGEFIQGFNFCKGWYSPNQTTYDGWEVDSAKTPLYIKVLPSGIIKHFKFPNW